MKLDGLKKIPFPLPCLRLPTAPAGQPGNAQAGIKREGVFDFLRIKARLA